MVTEAVTAPLSGLKLVMVGVASTVKLDALVTVIPVPLTATEIGPVVAPIGTEVVMLVGVEAVTVASVPLNRTSLSPGVALKFVPLIITDAVTAPPVGLKLEMVGVGITIKLDALVTVMPVPLTATETDPVVAPVGTVVVILVAVEAVTFARVPLNRTILLAGVVLKFVPVIITEAVTEPLAGEKPVIVGAGSTVKLEALVAVTPVPLTSTESVPVVAPTGTIAVILVAEEAVTVANVPLNLTTLFPGVGLKFTPERITVAPADPVVGVKDVIEGVGKTVKFEALVMVTPLVATLIGPVVAPDGTVVVRLVVVAAVTVASVPLKRTSLEDGVVLKFVPEIVTDALSDPLVGVKVVMVGVGSTVKDAALLIVTPVPLTVIEIGPAVAPAGTEVVRLVDDAAVTVANVPLKRTMLFAGVLLKFVPEITTVAVTAPLTGSNPEIVGVGITVKSAALVKVTPLTVIDIGPDVAPAGTEVVILEEVEEFTKA